MTVLEIILCCVFIGLTAWLLLKKVNPPTLLLSMGLVMIAVAAALGITPVGVEKGTGSAFFDLFRGVEEKFQQSIVRLGFMIMTIGGYVALMNRIKATDAMVYLATRPLAFLKGKPYLAAVAVIPIGMLLYLPIPSASGLGLLLASTLYPILVGLGVSRLTALSVISAATMFDMGPGSANGLRASELIGMDLVEYFVGHQLFLVGLTTVVVMAAYYFTSRYYDKRDLAAGKQIYEVQAQSAQRPDVPLWFAVFPVLPLVLLVVFSKYLGLFDTQINAAVAMLVCVAVVFVFLLLYQRNVRKSCDTLKSFWDGMGSVFSSVVTLIVAAEVFAVGLNALDFIRLLVDGTTGLGLGAAAVTVLMAATLFLSAVLMGSGNAAFFSFGPLVPGIAEMFGASPLAMILPIQLFAGMGRSASPIAAVNVAIAGMTGVSPVELARRNLIPMLAGALALLSFHFIFNWQ